MAVSLGMVKSTFVGSAFAWSEASLIGFCMVHLMSLGLIGWCTRCTTGAPNLVNFDQSSGCTVNMRLVVFIGKINTNQSQSISGHLAYPRLLISGL
jgi:hypothetical protein